METLGDWETRDSVTRDSRRLGDSRRLSETGRLGTRRLSETLEDWETRYSETRWPEDSLRLRDSENFGDLETEKLRDLKPFEEVNSDLTILSATNLRFSLFYR